jgi:hypothetical protein
VCARLTTYRGIDYTWVIVVIGIELALVYDLVRALALLLGGCCGGLRGSIANGCVGRLSRHGDQQQVWAHNEQQWQDDEVTI